MTRNLLIFMNIVEIKLNKFYLLGNDEYFRLFVDSIERYSRMVE